MDMGIFGAKADCMPMALLDSFCIIVRVYKPHCEICMNDRHDTNNEHRDLGDYLAKHRKFAGEISASQLGIQDPLLSIANISTLETLKKEASMFSGYESLTSTMFLDELKRQAKMFSGYDQLVNYSQMASVSNLKKMAGLGGLDHYLDAYQSNFAHMETQAIALGQLTHMFAQKSAFDQYRSITASTAVYDEVRRNYLDPFKVLFSQIAAGFESNTLAELQKYNQLFSKYFDSSIGIDIEINSDGMLSFEDETVAPSQVEDGIKSLAVVGSGVENYNQQFNEAWNKLRPGVKWVILYVLLPFYISMFSTLLTPLHVTWWQNYVASNPRSASKEIISEATSLFNRDDLTSHRFVKATTLNVRADGSRHAEIIGALPPGKTVKLIEKQKSWALVEYLDPDTGELQRGWVYSRYLHKFE